MGVHEGHSGCKLSRRGFLAGCGSGLVVGGGSAWLALDGWRHFAPHGQMRPFSGTSVEVPRAEGMPGRFPGRVIEVRNPRAVTPANTIDADAVRGMIDRGICQLTGADESPEAWRSFFSPSDVVGIKVNPVGRARSERPTAVGSISSPEVLLEVVRNLKDVVGIPPRNIIVFERYAQEFREAGYEDVMRTRPMADVRWYASALAYNETQVEIDGQDPKQNRDRNVVGYDPDVFVSMGFAAQDHDRRDDRRFRSHLSAIVTKLVNKIITLPCLKDHRSAGVTLALKNISHGMNNNVARSHISGIYTLDGSRSGPNQCNTFIPTAVAQAPLREKSTLHIMDGLIGVYEGGPGCWNRTWGTWQRKSLFFATDPVAMDHVCWDIIDTKRVLEGWRPVAQMGLFHQTQPEWLSPRLAAFAAMGTPEAALLAAGEVQAIPNGRGSEAFDRRTPEHIMLAGLLGLGRFHANEIDHRTSTMS